MSSQNQREWFIPGEGIDRDVISTNIQRYLGNDATVRPGLGTTGPEQGVRGYWIKAYRNLTTAMISDLRRDTATWRQERSRGTRGTKEQSVYDDSRFAEPDPRSDNYVGSAAYYQSTGRAPPARRPDNEGNSPRAPDYGGPPPSRDRIPGGRPPADRMEIDSGGPSRNNGGYGQPDRGYQQDGRNPRPYAADGRSSYQPESQPIPPGYGRGAPPVTSPYGSAPGYPPVYPPQPQPGGGAPPGYMVQGGQYVPVSSAPAGYDPISIPPGRPDPQSYGGNVSYGQQLPPQGRDARYPQQEYPDARYAYPSPAATVQSLPARDSRDAVSSPPLISPYGAAPPPPQYDQYGRPQEHSAQRPPGDYSSNSRDPKLGRDPRDHERELEKERAERERERERERPRRGTREPERDGRRHPR
ncbi:Hypothetical protein R9X50_00799800 [Acrodontium crateriforme]|uniref:Uncharacterized protein n=1 Tax=Acrodontium crateriforme TaxID=150365 RepID=A0AAQ3MAJ7_9PEZI|nr:Hypothetical protein R9X50_00799800 [Acrodontium crateriforme]